MDLEIVTSSDRPELGDEAAAAFRQRWPEFIFHDPIPPQYMSRVHDYFADLDILVLIDGHVAAGGWGVPFAWDGTVADLPEGYDAALVQSVEDREAGRPPYTPTTTAGAWRPRCCGPWSSGRPTPAWCTSWRRSAPRGSTAIPRCR